MTITDHAPIAFDPYDYAFQEDPYPVYARLREQEPLHYNEQHDLWVLSRYDDIQHALRTEGTYSNRMGVTIDRSAWNKDAHKVMSFLALDPPDHIRIRSLVARAFTPRRVRELGPRIQELIELYLDPALESGSFDWIKDFAGRLPMDVISEMMGVPQADRDEVRRLADLLVHREEGVTDVTAAGMEAAGKLFAYYAEMLAERRRTPTEDLTSALLAARMENGHSDDDKLTDEEIIAFLFLMVVAGNETTTKLLGHAVFHLTRNPDQERAVFDEEFPVEAWVEETLRFDPSTQMIARLLVQDVELHGRVAPAGSKAVVLVGSANRDPRMFSRPDVFDIHRDKEELAKSLSFGGGRHFCLGANLARLESQIALRELVKRVRRIHVDHDGSKRVHSVNVRGFSSVPMRVEVR